MMVLDISRPIVAGAPVHLEHFDPTAWPPSPGYAPADEMRSHPESRQLIAVKRALRIQALVDTGATSSAIHMEIARMFQLPVVGRTQLSHANGSTPADVVAAGAWLPQTDDGHQPRATNLQLISSNLGRVHMLFGMNLLNGGILTVDRIHQRWKWELKDPESLRRLGILPPQKAVGTTSGAQQPL